MSAGQWVEVIITDHLSTFNACKHVTLNEYDDMDTQKSKNA